MRARWAWLRVELSTQDFPGYAFGEGLQGLVERRLEC